MAFSVSEVIDTFKKSGLDVSNIKVDGGGSKNSILIQILSNSTKTNVERSKFHEMTAYGAFLMAKIKNEIGEIANLKKDFELFRPNENIDKIYQRWKMAEEISINWANLKGDDGYETLP